LMKINKKTGCRKAAQGRKVIREKLYETPQGRGNPLQYPGAGERGERGVAKKGARPRKRNVDSEKGDDSFFKKWPGL